MMQVCQLSQAGLQCTHCKTGSSLLNSKDLPGGSQQLQAAHPKQQNHYPDDPTRDPSCSHFCTESTHRTPEASAPPTKAVPPPGQGQETARRAEEVFNSFIKLNKALNICVLLSKIHEQQTKSVMGLNGSRTAGRAGNPSQHREDLFPYLMVIYALARAASALNIYHHCYLHL